VGVAAAAAVVAAAPASRSCSAAWSAKKASVLSCDAVSGAWGSGPQQQLEGRGGGRGRPGGEGRVGDEGAGGARARRPVCASSRPVGARRPRDSHRAEAAAVGRAEGHAEHKRDAGCAQAWKVARPGVGARVEDDERLALRLGLRGERPQVAG
jgi:hypothetical protein